MSGPLEHIAPCPPCAVQGFGVPGRASVWVSGQGSPGICDPQCCSSRCGKPRPAIVSITPDDRGADNWEDRPRFHGRSRQSACLSRLLKWFLPGLGGGAVLQSRVWGVLILSFPFQSDVSEKEQRWGAKAVPGSGYQEHIK